jgi:hypothetical protein
MKKTSQKKVLPPPRPTIYLLFNANEFGATFKDDAAYELDLAFLGSYATRQDAVIAWANHVVEMDNDLESEYFSKNDKLLKTEKDLVKAGWKILTTEIPEGAVERMADVSKASKKTKIAKSKKTASKKTSKTSTDLPKRWYERVVETAPKSKRNKEILRSILKQFQLELEYLVTSGREDEGLEPIDPTKFLVSHTKEVLARANLMYDEYEKDGDLDELRNGGESDWYREFLYETEDHKPTKIYEDAIWNEIKDREDIKKAKAKIIVDKKTLKKSKTASKAKKISNPVKVLCNFDPSDAIDSQSKDPEKWPIYSAKFGAWKFQKTIVFKKGMTEEETVKEVEKFLIKNWSKIEKSYFDGYIHDGVITVSDVVTLGPEDKVSKNRMSAHGKRHVVVAFTLN